MGFDYGALARSLAGGLSNYGDEQQRAKREAEKARRDAMHRQILDSLTTAQTEHMNAETAKIRRPSTARIGDKMYQLDEATGNWIEAASNPAPIRTTIPKVAAPKVVRGAHDQYRLDANGNPIALNVGVPSAAPRGGGASQQRQQLTLGILAGLDKATQDAENLERSTHGAAAKVSIGTAIMDDVGHVPLVGGPLQSAGKFLGIQSRDIPQQEYDSVANDWSIAYTHTLPGGSRAQGMTDKVKRTFFPPPGTTDGKVIDFFAARRRAIRDNIKAALAGRPMTPVAGVPDDLLPDMATIQQDQSGGAPSAPSPAVNRVAPKVNKRFWP